MIKLVIKHTSLIKNILVSVFVVSTLLGGNHKAYSQQCANLLITLKKAANEYKKTGVEISDFSGNSINDVLTNKEIKQFIKSSNADELLIAALKYSSDKADLIVIPKDAGSNEALVKIIESSMLLDSAQLLEGNKGGNSLIDPRGQLYYAFMKNIEFTHNSKKINNTNLTFEQVCDLMRAMIIKTVTQTREGYTPDRVLLEVGEGKDIGSFLGKKDGRLEIRGVKDCFSDIVQVREVKLSGKSKTNFKIEPIKGRTSSNLANLFEQRRSVVKISGDNGSYTAERSDGTSVKWTNKDIDFTAAEMYKDRYGIDLTRLREELLSDEVRDIFSISLQGEEDLILLAWMKDGTARLFGRLWFLDTGARHVQPELTNIKYVIENENSITIQKQDGSAVMVGERINKRSNVTHYTYSFEGTGGRNWFKVKKVVNTRNGVIMLSDNNRIRIWSPNNDNYDPGDHFGLFYPEDFNPKYFTPEDQVRFHNVADAIQKNKIIDVAANEDALAVVSLDAKGNSSVAILGKNTPTGGYYKQLSKGVSSVDAVDNYFEVTMEDGEVIKLTGND